MKSNLPTYGIVQKKKCRGSKVWYGWCRREGKTTYISLKTESKKVATEWKDRMNAARFFSGVALWGMSTERIDPIQAVEDYCSSPNLNAQSVATYRGNLKNFTNFCSLRGIIDLGSFSRENAEDYVKFYSSTCSAASINRHINSIKTVIRRAYQKARIDRCSPFDGVALPKHVKKEKPAWNAQEMQNIIEHAPYPELRIVWALMGYAGLRIHEAIKFKSEDIHGDEFVVDGKGNKVVRLPIGTRLREELERYKGALPVGIVAQTSSNHLRRVLKELGLKGTNHTFRHSFCTDMAKRNVNIAVAQKLMRHASSSLTLDVYTHVPDEEMKKAVK